VRRAGRGSPGFPPETEAAAFGVRAGRHAWRQLSVYVTGEGLDGSPGGGRIPPRRPPLAASSPHRCPRYPRRRSLHCNPRCPRSLYRPSLPGPRRGRGTSLDWAGRGRAGDSRGSRAARASVLWVRRNDEITRDDATIISRDGGQEVLPPRTGRTLPRSRALLRRSQCHCVTRNPATNESLWPRRGGQEASRRLLVARTGKDIALLPRRTPTLRHAPFPVPSALRTRWAPRVSRRRYPPSQATRLLFLRHFGASLETPTPAHGDVRSSASGGGPVRSSETAWSTWAPVPGAARGPQQIAGSAPPYAPKPSPGAFLPGASVARR